MRKLAGGLVFLAGVAACFGLGFYSRDVTGMTRGGHPDFRLGIQTTSASLSAEGAFRENYARILSGYEGKTDAKALKYAGMEGLVGALGDPHTNFFPPEVAKAFNEETRANFFGVGARLSADPLGAKAVTVFEDGPAYKSGLRASDIIAGVDGQKVAGKAIDGIVKLIKGPEGTMVKLTVVRATSPRPLEITIRRARIITPTVEGKYLADDKVGYLAVSIFSEPTADQFDATLAKLEKNPMRGLVIDMRGNPGGLLQTAVEMLSRYVENSTVVTMKFRAEADGTRPEEVTRTPAGLLHRYAYPIVILTDENSASAAEIFSGCMRDYGKAKLVGEHSYGKASVQNLFPLPDGSSAKITIAKYLLPKSGDIGRKVDEDGTYISGGLKPDVFVDPDYDLGFELGDPKKDNQLAKAIEVLGGR